MDGNVAGMRRWCWMWKMMGGFGGCSSTARGGDRAVVVSGADNDGVGVMAAPGLRMVVGHKGFSQLREEPWISLFFHEEAKNGEKECES
ncbi:hypothetical protein U1Q18_036047 [Sarracenia purpurea var. burkii]